MSKETSDWLTGWHSLTFDAVVALVALHVAAMLAYRLFKGQNLVGAMVTGTKLLPPGTAAPRRASRTRRSVLRCWRRARASFGG